MYASARSRSVLRAALEQRPHAEQEFRLVDRLGEEVVGAGFHRRFDVGGLVERGDHQHADAARRRDRRGAAGTPRNPQSFGIITSSRIRSGFHVAGRRERVLAVGGDLGLVAAAVEVGFEQLGVRHVVVGDQDARHGNLWQVAASAVIICMLMRAILNPKHESHVPPLEVENGAVIPCYEAPPRLAAIRAALEAAGGFTFEEPPAATEEALATVHDPAYIAYLREAAAELRRARGSTPRVRWPTVFPYGPNPRAARRAAAARAVLLRHLHADPRRHVRRGARRRVGGAARGRARRVGRGEARFTS